MENFFYNSEYCDGLEDLMLKCGEAEDEEAINKLPDDWSVQVELADLEPMVVLTPDRITERCVDEDRASEDGDEFEQITKILKENIDFDAINAKIPKLWYCNGEVATITKADLLEYIS